MKGERKAINGAEAEGAVALQKEAALSAGNRGGIVVWEGREGGKVEEDVQYCTEFQWRLIDNSTPLVPALL